MGEKEPTRSPQVKQPWVKRPLVWIGALATAGITGVATTPATEFTKEATGVDQSAKPTPSKPIEPTPSKSVTQAGAPVRVASVNFLAADGGESVAFPQPLELTESQRKGFGPEAGTDGGVIADKFGGGVVQLILQGNRSDRIRIADMRPLVECAAPLNGTIIYVPPQGDGYTAKLGFDLDRQNPIARTYLGSKGLGEPYFFDRTISLSHGEQQVFSIYVFTEQYCQFRLKLTVVDGLNSIFETIGNGKDVNGDAPPFKITAWLPDFSGYKATYTGDCFPHPLIKVDPAAFDSFQCPNS